MIDPGDQRALYSKRNIYVTKAKLPIYYISNDSYIFTLFNNKSKSGNDMTRKFLLIFFNRQYLK